jgi:hypothetical protein
MSSFQTFLERMGSNFLIAGLIPSMSFVAVMMFVFQPIMSDELIEWFIGTFNPLGQSFFVVLILTVIIGFVLTSLNTFTIKVFEGYILIWRIPIFRKVELRRYYSFRRKINHIEKKIKRIEKKRKFKKTLKNLLEQEKMVMTEFQLEFPSRSNEVLPTRFGNILKAAESYPMARYQIDAVPMWPRLIHVIPPSYDERIDQSHLQLSFLVNCAALSITVTIICLCTAIYEYALSLSNGNWFLEVSLVALLTAIVFNRASILSVSEFGHMIRSAYDLFRFDLLKQLHIPLPEDSESEYDLWTKITHTLNIGNVLEDRYPYLPMKYQHDKQDQNIVPQQPD